MAEVMQDMLRLVAEAKATPDADLQFLIDLETTVLQKLRAPVDAVAGQMVPAGNAGQFGPPPEGMMGGGPSAGPMPGGGMAGPGPMPGGGMLGPGPEPAGPMGSVPTTKPDEIRGGVGQ